MTLNPFQRLDHKLFDAFVRTNRWWIVTQAFPRCRNAGDKTPLLCTDYDDIGLALIHRKAVRDDPFGFILDLTRPAHKARLLEMMRPESRFLLYAAIVRSRDGLEKQFNKVIGEKIRRYITQHTSWHIAAGKSVTSSYDLTFGELFVNLKYGQELLRVRLEDVEKS